jgi:5-methylcytosine-specific restriction endonuclease McrA
MPPILGGRAGTCGKFTPPYPAYKALDMQRTDRAQKLADIAKTITRGDLAGAEDRAAREFPWTATPSKRQGIPPARALRVFLRDRFIDRYSGSRLAFPGALLVIGKLLPKHFPMHPTWKAGQSHDIFWELWPVVDHVHPVTRGGAHDESNFVTTSTINNVTKGNARLSDIGWELLPQPGPEEDWDGLVPWFREVTALYADLLQDSQIKNWNNALRKVGL